VIEPAVRKFTVHELEELNETYRQAGVEAIKYEDFAKMLHISHSHPRNFTE
jgi:hypothetical protein